MGIGDEKIGKSTLSKFAFHTVKTRNFKEFAQNFSRDTAAQGLDGLSANIQSHMKNKDDQMR